MCRARARWSFLHVHEAFLPARSMWVCQSSSYHVTSQISLTNFWLVCWATVGPKQDGNPQLTEFLAVLSCLPLRCLLLQCSLVWASSLLNQKNANPSNKLLVFTTSPDCRNIVLNLVRDTKESYFSYMKLNNFATNKCFQCVAIFRITPNRKSAPELLC